MPKSKTTRDRAASTASRLLRTSRSKDVRSVAASALAQSDPRPDRRPRRRRRTRTTPVKPTFKAGKDLVTDEPEEGGGTE